METRRQPIHHVGLCCMRIVHGAQFGAQPADVPVVDVATVSVAAVLVFKALYGMGV
jgi:hypothetical protein